MDKEGGSEETLRGCGLGPISTRRRVSGIRMVDEWVEGTYSAVDVEVGEAAEAVNAELLVEVVRHCHGLC